MLSHPQSLQQASSFPSASIQSAPPHSSACHSQNQNIDDDDVHHHATQQLKPSCRTASNCHLNSTIHSVSQENLVPATDSHARVVSHSHVQNPHDVDDEEDMMNFDTIHHTGRNQEMPHVLGHSAAFTSEPLTQTVADGASVIDALLPDAEADSLNVPLQISLGMDASTRTLDRSLLGGSPENDSSARNITLASNAAVFMNPGAVSSPTHGNSNTFPMHVSQSATFAYTQNGVNDNIMLHGGPSSTFSVCVEKESPLGDGTVATEVAAPMLMLRRAALRDTDAIPVVTIPARDEGDDIQAQAECPQPNARMSHPDTMRQDGTGTLSDGEGGIVEAVTSQGATNPAFGCNQISIQDLTKPKSECGDASTSQNAQFSPSSPAYSAVTVTSPAILQPSQSVAAATAAAAAAAAAAATPGDDVNAPRTTSSIPGHNANIIGDAGSIGGSGGINADATLRGDNDIVHDNEAANGFATVTQSNMGAGNGVQSPTSVTAPSGLICPLCKTQFTRRYNLKVHMTSKHSARRDYHCKQCPNAFNRGDSLKRHIATTHRGEKKWRCHYCQRDFGQRPHMKMHIDTVHLKKRDHKCHCGKAFGTRYNLTAHQRTHQQTPKKHVCGVCNKSFALKSSLARHQRNSGHGGIVDGIDDIKPVV